MKKLISKLTLLLTGFVALTGCEQYTKLTREEARENVESLFAKMAFYNDVFAPDQFSVDYSYKYKYELKNGEKWDNVNEMVTNANMYYDSVNGLGYINGTDTVVEGTKRSSNTYEAWLYKDNGELTLVYRLNLSLRNYFKLTSSSESSETDVYNTFLSLAHDFQYSIIVRDFFESILTYTDEDVCNFLDNEEGRSTSISYKTKGEKHLKINVKTSVKNHDLTTSYNEVFEVDNNYPVYNKSILNDEGFSYDIENDKDIYFRRNINKLWDLNVVQPKDRMERPNLNNFNLVESLDEIEGAKK